MIPSTQCDVKTCKGYCINIYLPKCSLHILFHFNSHLPLEEYNVLTDEYEVENGLYDVNLVLEDVNVNEDNEISLGCEITLPAPYDVTLKEELRINLLDFKSQESEDSVASGDDDCLFCDLAAGSGSGETVLEENEYDEEASGDSNILDYDNDWLNIYNDTEVASGSCESNCDTIEASGDEDYIENVADDSFSGDDEGKSGSMIEMGKMGYEIICRAFQSFVKCCVMYKNVVRNN